MKGVKQPVEFQIRENGEGANMAAMVTENLARRLTTWVGPMVSLCSGAFLFGHMAVGSDGYFYWV